MRGESFLALPTAKGADGNASYAGCLADRYKFVAVVMTTGHGVESSHNYPEVSTALISRACRQDHNSAVCIATVGRYGYIHVYEYRSS